MHELLQPAAVSLPEAVDLCEQALRSRSGPLRLVRSALPADLRPDLVALVAWWTTCFEVAGQAEGFGLQRELAELRRELEAAFDGSPTTPAGVALAATVLRHSLSPNPFRGQLQELERDRHVHAYGTRDELLHHARRIATPIGRTLLRVCGDLGAGGAESERREVLADALCIGIALTQWIADLRRDWRRGHTYLPVEDMVRFGVDLQQLDAARVDAQLQRLISYEVAWAREWLAKGWDLCRELGPWRGRQLAFLLRWHAATLSAVEERDFDVLSGPPRAGWLRWSACAATALATRAVPSSFPASARFF